MNRILKKVLGRESAFAIGAPLILWQILFFYIPLLCIVALSFSGYTFAHFLPFLSPVYAKVIVRSLALALSNACICFAIAYPVAYFLAFKVDRFKSFFLFLLIVPFWINFLLHIYAWFFVLERHGFINTILQKMGLIVEPLHLLNSMFSVSIMMAYYYLPFMILPIYSTLEKFDRRWFEASLDLGATWSQTIRRVLLPISLPGIQSGFLLVFVPSFGEFAIPELMGGDKIMFVGSVVSHYILGAETQIGGAAFTLLSTLALAGAALILHWTLSKTIHFVGK